jgi:hypothetical protein
LGVAGSGQDVFWGAELRLSAQEIAVLVKTLTRDLIALRGDSHHAADAVRCRLFASGCVLDMQELTQLQGLQP